MSESRKFSRIAIALVFLGLLAATGATSLLYLRAAEHNEYHRSMAAQNELLADLRWVYPPGTPRSVIFQDFDLAESDLAVSDLGPQVAIRPTLRRLDGEPREYRGFVFTFVEDTVARIDRIGPDGPGRTVDDARFNGRLRAYQGIPE